MGRVIFFLTITIVVFFAILAGHDASALIKVKSARDELDKEVNLPSAYNFQQRQATLLSAASKTWIPGLDHAVLGQSSEELLTSLSCSRATENPFAYLAGRGDTISFHDLDDANGNLYVCTADGQNSSNSKLQ
jgi:hypothetical protein